MVFLIILLHTTLYCITVLIIVPLFVCVYVCICGTIKEHVEFSRAKKWEGPGSSTILNRMRI